jgi:hypothetical protein
MPHLKQEITIDLLCHVNYVRRNSMWYENMFIALENEKDEERAAQMSAWKHGDVLFASCLLCNKEQQCNWGGLSTGDRSQVKSSHGYSYRGCFSSSRKLDSARKRGRFCRPGRYPPSGAP